MVLLGCIKVFLGLFELSFKKNNPMVPPLIEILKIGKNEKCSSFTRTISMLKGAFFANWLAFEPHSTRKKCGPSQNRNFEN